MNLPSRRDAVPSNQQCKSAGRIAVWRQLPIADTYLFSHVWRAAREGTAMFAGLVFVFAIIAGAREGGEPLNASQWLLVLALQTPRVLLFTLPMALLYACIKAFSELSERGELVALSASGQGWTRLLRAPLFLGLLTGLAAFLLQEWAVPHSERSRLGVSRSAAQTRARNGFEMTNVLDGSTPSGGAHRQIVHARSANFAGGFLVSPIVKELRHDSSLRRQIVAARGRWDNRAAAMVFENGWVIELPTHVNGIEDKKDDIKVVAQTFKRLTVRDFPPPQQWSGVLTLRDMIINGKFETLSLADLLAERARVFSHTSHISSVPNARSQQRALTFAIHDRVASPLICIALVLIGCPLGARAPRTRGVSALGCAMGVLLAYFAVWFLASHLAKNGAPLPMVWAYLPLLILCTTSWWLLRRKML